MWGSPTFWKIAGIVITVIGIIDIPDQIQRWIKYFQSLAGENVDWGVDVLGNTGRWIFTLSGVIVFLVAYDVPRRLWPFRKRSLDSKISLREAAVIAYEDLELAIQYIQSLRIS